MSDDTGFALGTAIRQAATMEVRQYAAIADWVRRRTDASANATSLPYAAIAAPMIWLFVIGSTAEVVVVHVLLEPLPVLRWVALVLGLWCLLWMVGFLAAYRVRPHLLGPSSLRVRAAAGVDLEVPLAHVEDFSVRERDLASSSRLTSVVEDENGRWCGVGVSGRTNLQLRLRAPVRIDDPRLGRTGSIEVDAIGLWVDDPRATRQLLAAATSRE